MEIAIQTKRHYCGGNMVEKIDVITHKERELVNITSEVKKIVGKSKVKHGIVILYVPHTTAALIINEGADPAVKDDVLSTLSYLIPRNKNYKHLEGNADAHIQSSIIGCEKIIFIEDANLILGRWQAIFFAEFDGPREREVYIKIIDTS